MFDRHKPSDKVLDLLSVIVASREALSAYRLGCMGFHQEKHIEALPGWGCLFFLRGSQLFVISSTLKDWHPQGLAPSRTGTLKDWLTNKANS